MNTNRITHTIRCIGTALALLHCLTTTAFSANRTSSSPFLPVDVDRIQQFELPGTNTRLRVIERTPLASHKNAPLDQQDLLQIELLDSKKTRVISSTSITGQITLTNGEKIRESNSAGLFLGAFTLEDNALWVALDHFPIRSTSSVRVNCEIGIKARALSKPVCNSGEKATPTAGRHTQAGKRVITHVSMAISSVVTEPLEPGRTMLRRIQLDRAMKVGQRNVMGRLEVLDAPGLKLISATDIPSTLVLEGGGTFQLNAADFEINMPSSQGDIIDLDFQNFDNGPTARCQYRFVDQALRTDRCFEVQPNSP